MKLTPLFLQSLIFLFVSFVLFLLQASLETSTTEGWVGSFSPTNTLGLKNIDSRKREKHNFKVLADATQQIGGIPHIGEFRPPSLTSLISFRSLFNDFINLLLLVGFLGSGGSIPSEKVVITFVSYLCARLVLLGKETRVTSLPFPLSYSLFSPHLSLFALCILILVIIVGYSNPALVESTC